MKKRLLMFTIALIFFTASIGFVYGQNKVDTKTSALIISNWPYKGQGKIAIYIWEGSNKAVVPSPPKNRSELTEEELTAYLVEALQAKPEGKRVAKCTSAYLSSPFKLVSDNGSGDWKGTGYYTVLIYGADSTATSIEKTDVYFSNGAATIDYNSMTINKKREK